MISERMVESVVGLFLIAAMGAMLVLAFKVSGLTSFFKPEGYMVTAQFDDIGQLKTRAAVKIGGVTVGEVAGIKLDPVTFKAVVKIQINSRVKDIPVDSTATILTAGLLGDNYIEITPMYSSEFLKEGSEITETHSAMILERLIGQFMYKVGGGSNSDSSTPSNNANAEPKKEGVTQ